MSSEMLLKLGEFTTVQSVNKKSIQAIGVRGQIPGGEKFNHPKSTQQKHQQGDLAMCYHHFFPEKNGGGASWDGRHLKVTLHSKMWAAVRMSGKQTSQ